MGAKDGFGRFGCSLRRASPFTFFSKLSLGGGAESAGGFVDRLADFVSAFAGDRACCGDEGLAFVGIHETGGLEQAGFVLGRYREKAVFVGVDELAGLDRAAEHFDCAAPAHGTTESVADAELASEGLEAGVVHLVDIANGAVDDGADATEAAVNIAVNLAPKSPDRVGLIKVLHDDDFRSGYTGDVASVIAPGLGIIFRVSGVAGFTDDGHGASDHRAHLGHEIMRGPNIEPVAGGVLAGDLFPAVVDRGGVPTFELEKVGVCQGGVHKMKTVT